MQNKIQIQTVINDLKTKRLPIDKACKIKKYLPIQEKLNFIKEHHNMMNSKSFGDIAILQPIYDFIYFHLLILQYYTNIEVEYTFDFFDLVMGNCIIGEVVDYIEYDYSFLKNIFDLTDGGE